MVPRGWPDSILKEPSIQNLEYAYKYRCHGLSNSPGETKYV
jgi:hypothetical protein